MRYFVTGASGNIGYWLVKNLTEQGHEVRALVTKNKAYPQLQIPGVVLFFGDITDIESMRIGMAGTEGVFHLAALARAWHKRPEAFEQINATGTKNVLQLAKELQIPRVVHCSSAGIYGPSGSEAVNENTKREIPFFNAYEKSKASALEWVKRFAAEGLNVCSVSPTRVYGPVLGTEKDSVNLLIDRVLKGFRFIPGKGDTIANYVHTFDVVQGMMLAMEKGKAGEDYILGGENCSFTSFMEMLRTLAHLKKPMMNVPIWVIRILIRFQMLKPLFGKEPLITPDWLAKVKLNWVIDASKAGRELGYRPAPLAQRLQETLPYYQ